MSSTPEQRSQGTPCRRHRRRHRRLFARRRADRPRLDGRHRPRTGPAARARRLHLARSGARLPDQSVQDPRGVRPLHRREVPLPPGRRRLLLLAGRRPGTRDHPRTPGGPAPQGRLRGLLGYPRRGREHGPVQGTLAPAGRVGGPRRFPHPGRRPGPGPSRGARPDGPRHRARRPLPRPAHGHRHRPAGRPGHLGRHRPGRLPGRPRGQRGRVLGPRDRPHGRHRRTPAAPRAPVREDRAAARAERCHGRGHAAHPALPGPRPVLPRAHGPASGSARTRTGRYRWTRSRFSRTTRHAPGTWRCRPRTPFTTEDWAPSWEDCRRLPPRCAPARSRPGSTGSSPSRRTVCRCSGGPAAAGLLAGRGGLG